jgi:hypothetical protein
VDPAAAVVETAAVTAVVETAAVVEEEAAPR